MSVAFRALLLGLVIFDVNGCSPGYKERFCSLSHKNRKLEGIRLDVVREAIRRCQTIEHELKQCYKSLAATPIFASDIKLMALLTAHRNFKLHSFYNFEYITHPLTFHNALDQIFDKERSAIVALEFAMEMLVETVKIIRDDYEKSLQLDFENILTPWKGKLQDDSDVFKAQLTTSVSAETQLNEAYITFIELYNALDEKDFTSVPIGVRIRIQELMKIHKDGYVDMLAIIQFIQKWVANVSNTMDSIVKECELSDIRSYREKECTIRHTIASGILSIVESYAQDFDSVCDAHLKKYYSVTPLSLIRFANEDQLDDLQNEIEEKYSTVSKRLRIQFDNIMREHDIRKARKLNDIACYNQMIKEKNIEDICKRQPFKRTDKYQ